jgi:hypothetical protein
LWSSRDFEPHGTSFGPHSSKLQHLSDLELCVEAEVPGGDAL